MKITQKRTGDIIHFYESDLPGAAAIARLYDGRDDIVYDQVMEDCTAAIMDRPSRNLADEFAAIGLDAATARMIDAMPNPDAVA